jgi:precorrin-6B methylase 2
MKIDKVKLEHIGADNKKGPIYSDGESEDKLLELFKNGLSRSERNIILSNNPDWPTRYHLSYERGNLLSWYPFKEDSRILEVGSGCGSITEVLVNSKAKSIVANELSERRATINAYRNKDHANLEVVVGNLQDYRPATKFDYVVCVGVLEYAGTFINSDQPYDEFVRLLKTFLKPNGKLLLAIENKLGFKYIAGAREDHTGGLFDGLNNYPSPKKVRTFGKEELHNLIYRNGLSSINFFYPHPDYKLPRIIFSDSLYPSKDLPIPLGMVTAPAYDQSRYNLFSEQSFVMTLEDNKLYNYFANSFLIEASQNELLDNSEIPGFYLSNNHRKPEYRVSTYAYQHEEGVVFKKKSDGQEAEGHVRNILKNYKEMKKLTTTSELIVVRPTQSESNSVTFPAIEGSTLERIFINHLLEGDIDKACLLIDKLSQSLESLSSTSSEFNKSGNIDIDIDMVHDDKLALPGPIDINLDNIIVDTNGGWNIIDYEWLNSKPTPLNIIFTRAIYSSLSRIPDLLSRHADKLDCVKDSRGIIIPKFLISKGYISSTSIQKVLDFEFKLQQIINGKASEKDFTNYTIINEKVNADKGYVPALEEHTASLTKNLKELKDQVIDLQTSNSKLTSDNIKLNTELNKVLKNPLIYARKVTGKVYRKVAKNN